MLKSGNSQNTDAYSRLTYTEAVLGLCKTAPSAHNITAHNSRVSGTVCLGLYIGSIALEAISVNGDVMNIKKLHCIGFE